VLAEGLRDGRWRQQIAEAASMLPRNSAERAAVEDVGANLRRLQQAHEAAQSLPDPAELAQVVRRPLQAALAQLERAVAQAESGDGWLEDEGGVPELYVDRVAEYFRLLAETPGAR
jgi:type II secretory pathway component PulM